ncbi:helicase-related protein [Micromonospora sp. NPDC007208]|uniref:helicase-related protein n=1 Tax=Micromonospora sp. NPDC007208 TaxID=3364236 RepID=UPI0036BBDCE7
MSGILHDGFHSPTAYAVGDWTWWTEAGQACQVLAVDELWGAHLADVYTPDDHRVRTVPLPDLAPIATRPWAAAELRWRAAALRVHSLAAAGEPIAVGTASVRLLPHQSAILTRALRMDPVRLAICCQVGLGKTTTAGAIMGELVARGRARRILVIAPKGVQLQWVAEMQEKFGTDFVRIGPEGVPVDSSPDIWRAFDRVVTSIDAVKPMRRRAGWTPQQVAQFNESRYSAVVDASWDIVVIDEAHRVAGSDEDVARHRLAAALATAAPHLLLLTATPHSGKSESFRRFLGLLDDEFVQGRPVNADTVASVVARTDKRTAVDHDGRLLFRPRITALDVVSFDRHPRHRALYEAVTDFVRTGYTAAQASGNTAIGFLMLLFQRMVTSSTPALLSALERRRLALAAVSAARRTTEPDVQQWLELTGEDAEALLDILPADEASLAALDHLLELARSTTATGPDPKTLHFLDLLRRLQRSEGDPSVKVLVFTEFRATQQMLADLLNAQGIRTVTIDGRMGLSDRADAQRRFAEDAQVLVSTDAGGEGVNLQFAHVVVNWDLGWAPTAVEQRVGRVDRLGQTKVVKAFNLVLADTVDERVIEVLTVKLERILAELGVDARADVLDSAAAHVTDLYVAAIVEPDRMDDAAKGFEQATTADVRDAEDGRRLLAELAVSPPPPPPSRMPALLAAAASGSASLGANRLGRSFGQRRRPGPRDPLAQLPTVAPGEPAPVIRGDAPGWLLISRVTVDARTPTFSATALFIHDSGRADPVRGDQLWSTLSDGELEAPLMGTARVSTDQLKAMAAKARDYAYRSLQKLAAGQPMPAPSIRPALLVRVQP